MLKRQLLKLLSNLPNTQEVKQRKALLVLTAFEQLLPQIDLQGDNFTFFAGLIEVLTSEGQASLLEFIDNLIESPWSGLETREQLKSLRSAIAELKVVQWRREFVGEVDGERSQTNPPQNIPRNGAIKFVGRSKELEMLHNQLERTDCDAIVTIVGMAGVGKTELAVQYARQYWQQFYPAGVCWLYAREPDFVAQIVKFAQIKMRLSVPQSLDGETLTTKQRIGWCWENWQPPELPVLVVLDDVTDYESIKPYLPLDNLRFKILITTRRQWICHSFVPLPLDILNEVSAIELLKYLVGAERIEEELLIANELCNWLGYLPLGLELVGGYLQRKTDLSLEILLRQKLKKRPEPLNKIEEAFKLSWQELDTQAQQLGCLLSLFALAPIPWSLVELCFPEQDPDDLENIRDDSLINLSLLKRTGRKTYQLHQLVREFLNVQLEQSNWAENLKQQFCRVMVNDSKLVPQSPTQDVIEEVNTAVPHIVEAATTLNEWLSDEDFCYPFVALGRFYAGQGIYDKAEDWYQQYLSVSQTRFGNEHIEVASSLNNLALLYCNLGRYSQAKPLFKRALNLSKRLLGEMHPYVATTLNNLALLYCEQGRPIEAEPLFQRALEIREQCLGRNHLDVATTLNNQAYLFSSLGYFEQAERLLKKALEIREQCLGRNHPDVASTLNNLAHIYENQKHYSKAESLYRDALKLRKNILGEKHPDVAQSLHNLGVLLAKRKQYQDAKPLVEQALEIYDKCLGTRHRDTRSTRISLQNICDELW
ncbi:MAG: tetratricopeptide repeat protein [Nostoc indistinguendum CM1-VF10]|jgi:tetratricopeptide (TPR) repeat protein|nr:tetratricopeptide repeat protein [Nostoc indistinguendum CM1-VF10]